METIDYSKHRSGSLNGLPYPKDKKEHELYKQYTHSKEQANKKTLEDYLAKQNKFRKDFMVNKKLAEN